MKATVMYCLAFSVITFISFCTYYRYADICDSWTGKNLDDLIDYWGYPNDIEYKSNGEKIFVYEDKGFYSGTTTGYDTFCKVTFLAYEDDVIYSWRYRSSGNMLNPLGDCNFFAAPGSTLRSLQIEQGRSFPYVCKGCPKPYRFR